MLSNKLVALRRNRDEGKFLGQLRAAVSGDVCFDRGTRGAYSHDASNYRHAPIGVVMPKTEGDVLEVLRLCREHGAPTVSRGGGTSLAGQTINEAVVLDFSRHLCGVLDIDAEARVARVLPGTVLDDLRAAAKPHGLTFGPDPATHKQCTLGGMLGNNACGIHAVQSEFYGPGARTSDNVESLDIVTYDGERMTVGATSDEALERILAGGGRRAAIYGQLRDLRDRHAERIRAEFPNIPRRVSGYNLPDLLPERGFNLARALVGSEATCVTVLSATVTLIPALAERVLVAIGYDDIGAAGDAIPQIREFRPVGCEGFDRRLVELVEARDQHKAAIARLPPGQAWLLVEFGAAEQAEAEDQARALIDALGRAQHPSNAEIIENPQIEHCLWELRESGLSATAKPPEELETWPGWEDSAVPTDRVGDYLRDLGQLLDRRGHNVSLYGHFAQGCIHTRISFDLSTASGIERYREFTEEAAELVVRHGGSLSGEHGDGQARGDLLAKMYSPEIMGAMREFKRIWDPEQRMNPGRVIDALPRTEALKLARYHPDKPKTSFSFPEDHGDFVRAANRCVGVGECRRDSGGVMCPSYMVTKQERHSTRGRARLLFEMLMGEVVRDGWQSEEVFDALDLCLACKGCKRECPVEVDMATYKAEFASHYYQRKWRPRQAYTLGWIHRWARIGAMMPRLGNLATQTPGLAWFAKWVAGASQDREIPRLAKRSFRRAFADRPEPNRREGRRVLLWPDTFNNTFFPEVLMAATQVLEQAGYVVTIPSRQLCCGRALYDFGMLDTAKALWEETLASLATEIAQGTPVVGLEPSCVAAFRDELPNLFPNDPCAQRLARQTYTLAGLLDEHEDLPFERIEVRALVHYHCHHRSIMGIEAEERLLERLGVEVEIPELGCCGMAGAFGFEPEKYAVSIAIGERALLPAMREAAPGTVVLTDGFSCREQVRQGSEQQPMHLAELLTRAIPARKDDSHVQL